MGELVVARAGGHAWRAIVRVILKVGSDMGKVWQTVIRQVSCELREGNHILLLDRVIDDVGVVNERVVAARVRVDVGAKIADRGKTLRIRLPGLASRHYAPY